MKLDELKIRVPTLKPRNSTYQTLAAKKNAAGPHRDKKAELKKGLLKHKRPGFGQIDHNTPFTEQLGEIE